MSTKRKANNVDNTDSVDNQIFKKQQKIVIDMAAMELFNVRKKQWCKEAWGFITSHRKEIITMLQDKKNCFN